MAVFKCKMCGGTLEINNNESVAVCEYCGTKQTLPRLDNERKVQLYDRANYFRRENEFDKAMGIYEMILSEDKEDCESYWGIVLCRYGIEYVEDPRTHKRIPTVNRAQFTSIFDDEDYKKAIEYSNTLQRVVYEEEADVIDKIQKGILEISNKEEPFDVFICYKETDASGNRTQDSVYAQDIYTALTKEGYKVFFSRITLENKLGSAYEPYIFAALNSARVMLVVGTNKDNFNAVWVKNEWSRYLTLIKLGKEKTLIPVFKDMSPYDMPEEFQYLQSQDMGKIGYLQDLVHGIKKIVKKDEPQVIVTTIPAQATTVVKETVVTGGNPTVDSLLERAFIFLGDMEWESANEYCEKVLDIEPKNAQAYLGKLLVEKKVTKKENLRWCNSSFEASRNYYKAISFGDEALVKELTGYIKEIKDAKEKRRIKEIYDSASRKMDSAVSEDEFKDAARAFSSIKEYENSATLARECVKKAEIARREEIYEKANSLMLEDVVSKCETAIEFFELISGWKDVDDKILACKRKIEDLKVKEEAYRIERERKEEQDRIACERKAEEERKQAEEKQRNIAAKKKKNKKLAISVSSGVALVLVFAIVLINVIIPNNKYNKALVLMNDGKYEEAIKIFDALDGYKDSVAYIEKSKAGMYEYAETLMVTGDYKGAKEVFDILADYKDSFDKAILAENEICYTKAQEFLSTGSYESAYEIFSELGEFKNCQDKAIEIRSEHRELVKPGDIILFGNYEQDNDKSNGKEPIRWIALDVQEDKMLVVSEYGLANQPFHDKHEKVDWKNCYLREWLNSDFFSAAFDSEEQKFIIDKSKGYFNTKDYQAYGLVFVLSADDFYKYEFVSRDLELTDYAIAQGGDSNRVCWWLAKQSNTWWGYYVTPDKVVSANGARVNDKDFYVRPAMWIEIE